MAFRNEQHTTDKEGYSYEVYEVYYEGFELQGQSVAEYCRAYNQLPPGYHGVVRHRDDANAYEYRRVGPFDSAAKAWAAL
jgi:hypothetical protein